IGPVRKALGIRTLFNLLGPMINPACPSHLLMGVASPEMVPLMANTLVLTGVKRAVVVCGAGGYDEVTPLGPAAAMLVENGVPAKLEIVPSRYDIEPCRAEELSVHSADEAAEVMRELLKGRGPAAMRSMVILNVALGIFLMEKDASLEECVARARDAVLRGAAQEVLHAA
ncbi:MAG: anthranilate phosphoribosyltransferase, partial [Desulfovibrionaceae bacterium]|nr:anthranilate phosphoribosyltransferase [Desulfovibrionaceae bacterium]